MGLPVEALRGRQGGGRAHSATSQKVPDGHRFF